MFLRFTNIVTCLAWFRVLALLLFVFVFFDSTKTMGKVGRSDMGMEELDHYCDFTLRPALYTALGISWMEFVTSLLGLTRSKPLQVLLFATVRSGTEFFVTPMIGCTSWQHLFTAFCWSIGEVVRFGCFALDGLVPDSHLAKSIRYTVGPILFPLGAAGEMFMVIRAGRVQNKSLMYVAALLWPLGFYPLMKQLLLQRRKHFGQRHKQDKPNIKQI